MEFNDLYCIDHVIKMMIDIDDVEMETTANDFLAKSNGSDIYFLSACYIKNILHSFNMLVEIKYSQSKE